MWKLTCATDYCAFYNVYCTVYRAHTIPIVVIITITRTVYVLPLAIGPIIIL